MTHIESLLESNSRQEIDRRLYEKNRGNEAYSPENEDRLQVHLYSPHTLQRIADSVSLGSKPQYLVKFEDDGEERYFTYNHEDLLEVEDILETEIEESPRLKAE